MKDFIQKNFSVYHIVGIIIFVVLAVFYWYKSGQFSDNVLQNNLFLMIIWGVLVGYITADMVRNAVNRNNNPS